MNVLLLILACLPPSYAPPIKQATYQKVFRVSETDAILWLSERHALQREVRTAQGTRCDLVSDRLAIEVDWPRGSKPYEALGQSLHYAYELQKKPAICFLIYGRSRETEAYIASRIFGPARMAGVNVYTFDLFRGDLKLWNY